MELDLLRQENSLLDPVSSNYRMKQGVPLVIVNAFCKAPHLHSVRHRPILLSTSCKSCFILKCKDVAIKWNLAIFPCFGL